MPNNTNQEPLEIVLEGLLFSFGTETSVSRLAKIVSKDKKEVTEALQRLKEFYETTGRGITLMVQEDKVQMVTSSRVAEVVTAFQKSELEGPLSRAALETLSIIAYKGPITKPEIDTIRGVNSGLMLRSLLIRGLVDRKKAENDARTFTYSISFDLLRHLGVTSQQEIPGYKEFAENKVLEKLAEGAREAEQALEKKAEAVAETKEADTALEDVDAMHTDNTNEAQA
jgi:segregation and condensation protein B